MWNPPTILALATLPEMDVQKSPLNEKVIYMHFFIAACDWYVAEYDPKNRLFYGFAILDGDTRNAEWGIISLDELLDAKKGCFQIERDAHWTPAKAGDIEKIRQCARRSPGGEK